MTDPNRMIADAMPNQQVGPNASLYPMPRVGRCMSIQYTAPREHQVLTGDGYLFVSLMPESIPKATVSGCSGVPFGGVLEHPCSGAHTRALWGGLYFVRPAPCTCGKKSARLLPILFCASCASPWRTPAKKGDVCVRSISMCVRRIESNPGGSPEIGIALYRRWGQADPACKTPLHYQGA